NKLCLSLNFLILICVLKGWYHFKPVSGTVLDWRRNFPSTKELESKYFSWWRSALNQHYY
ncbi:MAG: hypothetical protein PHN68_01360, partial [Prolixibacteraceae bacterium]|nr:hypothetical protein [Prolixibacteraceae bacterium]